jgi:hypothetical protein
MKNSGFLAGRKTLIGGFGPFMVVSEVGIMTNGSKVHAVVDQNGVAEKLKAIQEGVMNGWQGKVLRVNLTDGTIKQTRWIRKLPEIILAVEVWASII